MAFPTFSGMVFEFQRAFREPRLQGAGRSIMSAVSLSQASIIKRLLSSLLLSQWSPKACLYSCLFLFRAPDNHLVVARRGLSIAVRPHQPRCLTQPSGTLPPLKTLPGKLAKVPVLSDPANLPVKVSASFILLTLGPLATTFIIGFSREMEPTGCMCLYREKFITRNKFWKLASPKSSGWTSRLKTQERSCSSLKAVCCRTGKRLAGEAQRQFAGEFSLAQRLVFLFCASFHLIE